MAEFVIEGMPELEAKLKALERVAQKQILMDAVKEGAELIRASAEERAPRDTGQLAESIMFTLAGGDNIATEVTAKIGPRKSAFYGIFQEFGTAHHAPQPFLQPAMDEQRENAVRAAAAFLKNAISDVTVK